MNLITPQKYHPVLPLRQTQEAGIHFKKNLEEL